MGLLVSIPQKVITFSADQREKWIRGERDDCADTYCKNLPGLYGFGEYLAGKYYEKLGYRWIHHDYTIFGGNRLGKYPLADEVLRKYFGEKRFMMMRTISKHFDRFQEPDLMVFKPDYSELRFAECKLQETRDKLDIEQGRSLAIIAALLECEVEMFLIAKETNIEPPPISFELPEKFSVPDNLKKINDYIQYQLKSLDLEEVRANEAARWLDQAGLLSDSKSRPGKPLRNLLRMKLIIGQYQTPGQRWFIKRID